jgi:hypothetical protein
MNKTVPRNKTLNNCGFARVAIQPEENSTSGVKMPTSIESSTNGPAIRNNRQPVTV